LSFVFELLQGKNLYQLFVE